MPFQVRLSSPVSPGPVFCCATAGTEAVIALTSSASLPMAPKPVFRSPATPGSHVLPITAIDANRSVPVVRVPGLTERRSCCMAVQFDAVCEEMFSVICSVWKVEPPKLIVVIVLPVVASKKPWLPLGLFGSKM